LSLADTGTGTAPSVSVTNTNTNTNTSTETPPVVNAARVSVTDTALTDTGTTPNSTANSSASVVNSVPAPSVSVRVSPYVSVRVRPSACDSRHSIIISTVAIFRFCPSAATTPAVTVAIITISKATRSLIREGSEVIIINVDVPA